MKLLVLLNLLFLTCLSAGAQSSDTPNILWIVSEDNSPLIGAYGDEFATTPNIDKFAQSAVRYTNAFATSPVCAPSRFTLITGMYASSMGTEHMRSTYPVSAFVKFFPRYLREAGYYTTNNSKKDYNTVDQPEAWDESSQKATYRNRKEGQPFFAVFNIHISHESQLHTSIPDSALKHDPDKVPIPPYHPATPEMKHDWAQYYDRVSAMDEQVGRILNELDEAGLRENTIVFYYSDHGGVVARSKRFMYESGLRVPLIIRFPKKFQHLAPAAPGTAVDRLVSFVDFAPTILKLAGLQPPAYMQGAPFLGRDTPPPAQYTFACRGRMDERLDMMRSARDKRYRYIRNYYPHKIYGQYLDYLWKAPSAASWEKAWHAGSLNDLQSVFWKEKPAEELYDVQADPHNVRNLANEPEHQEDLKRLRDALYKWMLESKDLGFLPEPMLSDIAKKQPPYDYARSGAYRLESILEIASLASSKDPSAFGEIQKRLTDRDPVIRYWAATGCTVLADHAKPARRMLTKLLSDPEISVRIAAAEALYAQGETVASIKALDQALESENLMARVQSLNVLENIGDEARPLLGRIKSLLKDNVKDGEYDARIANHIMRKLQGSE